METQDLLHVSRFYKTDIIAWSWSYARKLVTVISGGVFCNLDPVLEQHSFDEFGELV